MNRRRFIIKSTLLLGAAAVSGIYWTKRWNYIVIHHSAGAFGNIEFLQRVHRERQAGDPVDAIPYHYIVGNGSGLPMGKIASDWRRRYHIWGAHVSGRNVDYNFRGIGICLVGNFEKRKPPTGQYQSLVKLTKTLMAKYHIPADHVIGHGFIKGEATKCPGRLFPMDQFKSDIV